MNRELIALPISTLAYIGDAIYELLIREALCEINPLASGPLHGLSVNYVKASAQADMVKVITEYLNEFESSLLQRAMNRHPGSMPKHADQATYRKATGLEALFGYLYLDQQYERIRELICLMFPEFKKLKLPSLRAQ